MSLTDKSRIEINPLRDFRYVANATRYAFGSICLLRKRGIYLISNWCSQSERQYIELERSESISSQLSWHIDRRKNESKSTRRKCLYSCSLSVCIWVWAYPILHLFWQIRCSRLTVIFKFSAKSITRSRWRFFLFRFMKNPIYGKIEGVHFSFIFTPWFFVHNALRHARFYYQFL